MERSASAAPQASQATYCAAAELVCGSDWLMSKQALACMAKSALGNSCLHIGQLSKADPCSGGKLQILQDAGECVKVIKLQYVRTVPLLL